MQTGEKKKTWDSIRFRREHMTHWQKGHPVIFPHLHTDHWSKMKTTVPVYLASVPVALLEDRVFDSHKEGGEAQHHTTTRSPLPPLTCDEDDKSGMHQSKPSTSPQNMPQYRNVYNDRARRDFCYWFIDKRGLACKGHSFGAYKTYLGLPKV
ncbi:uncharacterized protein LOC118495263 isoform X2 [Xyrichtys novacula]|uniref:Uncharacterized protein LOC118495263 isoform X2 n=1 Tax=Xyrichtys novacula TaxID=13765 RepID=A0AAV1EQK0_XYRNO|nr:uncharacterized protein LOC118495263 isoform X2 [Xyrichtys novacula]